MIEFLKKYKDHIGTTATLIGIITASLYVVGYVAERVHWNFLGHIEVPTSHLEFLYRGGNIVISYLATFPLYLVGTIKNFNAKAILILTSILVMLIAKYFDKLPRSIHKFTRLKQPFGILLVSFFLLAIILLIELLYWPPFDKNLLFQENPSVNLNLFKSFYRNYVGISGLWLIFLIISRQTWIQFTMNNMNQKNRNGSYSKSVFVNLFPFIKKTSAIVLIIIFTFLPAVYGTYAYPHFYPIVQVLLINDAPDELHYQINKTDAMAVLFETNQDYLFYTTLSEQPVLKIKKSLVSALVVYKTADILDPNSFKVK